MKIIIDGQLVEEVSESHMKMLLLTYLAVCS